MRLCAASRPVSSLPDSSSRRRVSSSRPRSRVSVSRLTRFAVGAGVQCTSGQRARSGGSRLAAPRAVEREVRVPRRRAVRDHADRLAGGVRRIVEDLDVEHRRQSAQALRADAERVDLVVDARCAAPRARLAGPRCLSSCMSIGSISASLASSIAFSALPPMPMPSMPGGHQPAPIVGTVFTTQSTIESDGLSITNFGLVLRAAALGRDLHLDRVAGHEVEVDDRRRVVARVLARAGRVGDDRRAQRVVRIEIGAAHAFVDHVGRRHRRAFPAHVHADLHERDDDAGVLADRPMAFGAHARIGEDLRDRVLRRRRLLGRVGVAERLDVVERMVVGDVLQRVGDALDEVLLLDRRHGWWSTQTAGETPGKARRIRLMRFYHRGPLIRLRATTAGCRVSSRNCTVRARLGRLRSSGQEREGSCPSVRAIEEAGNMSTIESVSNETRVFEPPRDFVAQANVTRADFDAMNAAAAADFAGFWAKLARENLLWHKPFTKTLDESQARRSTSGSTTASSTSRTTASTAISRTATPTRSRSSSRPTTARSPGSPTRSSTTASAASRTG